MLTERNVPVLKPLALMPPSVAAVSAWHPWRYCQGSVAHLRLCDTFVLFCFVYLLARVRWDMSDTALGVCAPRAFLFRENCVEPLTFSDQNCSTVRLFDCSTVRLFDCSTVRLFDCSTVRLFDCSTHSRKTFRNK